MRERVASLHLPARPRPDGGYLIERTSARTTVFLAGAELALAALALALALALAREQPAAVARPT